MEISYSTHTILWLSGDGHQTKINYGNFNSQTSPSNFNNDMMINFYVLTKLLNLDILIKKLKPI